MTTTLEESSAAIRAAVSERMAATPADDPKMVGYVSPTTKPRHSVASTEEMQTDKSSADVPVIEHLLQRQAGDGVLSETYAEWDTQPPKYRPGTDAFVAVLEELRSLHLRKTLDYGVDEDALANIRNSADVINVPAYAGCVLRMADKMQRLRSFFRRGEVEFDGVEDTLLDIAAYAAIALVVYREHASG
jgi:hypothetical protein